MEISGKKLFVNALLAEGVDKIFTYPGGMIVDILDELYIRDGIDMILPRHEQALVHEAEGYARATGKTGVCLVTSGPGATNTVTAIADAYLDSIPLVVFTGQVPLGLIGNEAFQEVDIVGMTRGVTKYSVTVKRREDLGPIIKKAFYIARTGKPGPVLVDIPKNLQQEMGPSEYPDSVSIRGYKINEGVHGGQLKRAYQLLRIANRPVILAGQGVNIAGAQEALSEFSQKTHIPVVTTVMGKGAVSEDHPFYIGNSGMHGRYAANMAVSECDVLFSIGTRFNDRITGDLNQFAQRAKIIHVDIDAASISRNVSVDVPIVADAKAVLTHMLEWASEKDLSDWHKQIAAWGDEHPLQMKQPATGLCPQTILEAVNKVFSDGAIYTTDVGQHQMWAFQYLKTDEKHRIYGSGGLGTMGFGFPAAVGAKIGCPDQPVVCITGDGGFQMNMQEMATSRVYDAPVIVVLLNNHWLGMVRQFQDLFYGKRYSATCLSKTQENLDDYYPDFVKWAQSYGAQGFRVVKEEEIIPALEAAKASGVSAVIECMITEDMLVMPMVPGGKPMNQMILDK